MGPRPAPYIHYLILCTEDSAKKNKYIYFCLQNRDTSFFYQFSTLLQRIKIKILFDENRLQLQTSIRTLPAW